MKPYFEQDGVTIYNTRAEDILGELGAFDLIVTDPPFYLPARIATSRKAWPRSLGDLGIMEGYFRGAFKQMAGALRPTGALYTFSDSTSYAVFLSCLYPIFDRTQCIVWDKGKGGLGNGWRHSTELIIHGAFGATSYTSAFRRDLLQCSTVASEDREHPAEKPVSLIAKLLQAHPRGVVLDPYMGAGTTLFAARSLGWQAIGIDVDEGFCESAANKFSQQVLPLEV